MKKLLYRLPDETNIHFVEHSPVSLNKKISFFPFCHGDVLSIWSDEIKIITTEELKGFFSLMKFYKENLPVITWEEYKKDIDNIIAEIKKNSWRKLVVSRVIEARNENIDWEKTFLSLCKNYPSAFCYFLVFDNEVWIGATPELLGNYDKSCSIFKTMSLAGTLEKGEEWTNKEIEEQKPVTDYIREVLEEYSGDIEISKTYNCFSGNIQHLRNDFRAKIRYPNVINSLVEKLHPTPAVCGIPKKSCMDTILKIEKHQRSYYSGYIYLETEQKSEFFVNLRCAKITEDKVFIFVGGGITAKSDPKNEWKETELKSQAILKNLHKISYNRDFGVSS